MMIIEKLQKLKKLLHENRGVTIVEVVLAITILSIAATVLITCFGSAVNMSCISSDAEKYQEICDNIFEEMRAVGAKSYIAEYSGQSEFRFDEDDNEVCTVSFGKNQGYKTDIELIADNADLLIYECRVKIYKKDNIVFETDFRCIA